MGQKTTKPSIEQVAWVFEHLKNHLNEGGSFRHLIYNRLDFNESAYCPLHLAGGIDISNALNDAKTVYERSCQGKDMYEGAYYTCKKCGMTERVTNPICHHCGHARLDPVTKSDPQDIDGNKATEIPKGIYTRMDSESGYLRCRYCDSNWSIDTAKAIEFSKDHYVCHRKFYFTCPACGFSMTAYLFVDE